MSEIEIKVGDRVKVAAVELEEGEPASLYGEDFVGATGVVVSTEPDFDGDPCPILVDLDTSVTFFSEVFESFFFSTAELEVLQ